MPKLDPAIADRARPVLSAAAAGMLRELTRPWAPPRGGRVLVAVSGGADSMALLHLLAALAPGRGWTLTAASLDHGLRGKAGAADVEFVGTAAADLGIDLIAGRAPDGLTSEADARDARRAFLAEAAATCGAVAIALGHSADDQAETVLHRLLRGTGARGLAGMRRWTAPYWRPLLAVRRAELRALLEACGREWIEDPSNASRDFTRNRIRLDLLPELERAAGPGAVAALVRAADLAADDEAALEAAAAEAATRAVTRTDPSVLEIERRAVVDLPPAVSRRMLRACCERLAGGLQALTAAHIAALLALARADSPGTRVDLPLGLSARRRGRKLVLARASAPEGSR